MDNNSNSGDMNKPADTTMPTTGGDTSSMGSTGDTGTTMTPPPAPTTPAATEPVGTPTTEETPAEQPAGDATGGAMATDAAQTPAPMAGEEEKKTDGTM